MRRARVRGTIALAALALAAASAPAEAFAQSSENPWLERRVLHIAHQGGEIEAPSNTLFAFKTALDKGADVLELDVHATADGELVVRHDATVDRTTGGSGTVDEMTVAQLKALDAAYWFVPECGTCHDRPVADYAYRGFATGERPIPRNLGEFTPNDFRIPTLREVLSTFPHEFINIEIKATAPDTTPYEGKLAALLAEFDRGDDTIVVSFHDAAMASFELQASEVSTAPAIGELALFWASVQGPAPGIPLPRHHAVQVPISYQGLPVVTEDFVSDAHANGLAVHVWTVNERAEMRWLIDIGVDGIMTDRPTVLAEVLRER